MSAVGYVSPYLLALIHTNLGEHEQAISYLQQALAIKDAWLNWLAVEPQFDVLRSDMRFAEVLKSTRNPATPSAAAARHAAAAPAQIYVERTALTTPIIN